jgi:hypothetical protein
MKGFRRKYQVTRIGDAAGKHDQCVFFVLDLTHDGAARRAALEYATAKNDPELLRSLAETIADLS